MIISGSASKSASKLYDQLSCAGTILSPPANLIISPAKVFSGAEKSPYSPYPTT